MSETHSELEETEVNTDEASEEISLADQTNEAHASSDTTEQTSNAGPEGAQPESLNRIQSVVTDAEVLPSSVAGANIDTEWVLLDEGETDRFADNADSLQVLDKKTRSPLSESEKFAGVDLGMSEKTLGAEISENCKDPDDDRIQTKGRERKTNEKTEENKELDEDDEKDIDDEKDQRSERISLDGGFLEDEQNEHVNEYNALAGSSLEDRVLADGSLDKINVPIDDRHVGLSERKVVSIENTDGNEQEAKVEPTESTGVIGLETKVPREFSNVDKLETSEVTKIPKEFGKVGTKSDSIDSDKNNRLGAGILEYHKQLEEHSANIETTDKEPMNKPETLDVPIDRENMNEQETTDVPIYKEPMNKPEITDVPIDKETKNEPETTDVPIDKEHVNEPETTSVPIDKEHVNELETTSVPIDKEHVNELETTSVPIDKEHVNEPETTDVPIDKEHMNTLETPDVLIDKEPMSKSETTENTLGSIDNKETIEIFSSERDKLVIVHPESYDDVSKNDFHPGVTIPTETKTEDMPAMRVDDEQTLEKENATPTPQEDTTKTSFDLPEFSTSSLTLLKQGADGAHPLVSCNIKPHVLLVVSESTREPKEDEALTASTGDAGLSPIREENYDNITSIEETSQKHKNVKNEVEGVVFEEGVQNIGVDLEKSEKEGTSIEADNAPRDDTPSNTEPIEEVSKDSLKDDSSSTPNTNLAASSPCHAEDRAQEKVKSPAANMSRMSLLIGLVIISGVASAVVAPFVCMAAGFEEGGIVAGSLAESLMEYSSSIGFGMVIIDMLEAAGSFNVAVLIFIGLWSGVITGGVFLASGMFRHKVAAGEKSGDGTDRFPGIPEGKGNVTTQEKHDTIEKHIQT